MSVDKEKIKNVALELVSIFTAHDIYEYEDLLAVFSTMLANIFSVVSEEMQSLFVLKINNAMDTVIQHLKTYKPKDGDFIIAVTVTDDDIEKLVTGITKTRGKDGH